MFTVIGVKFRNSGRSYYFDPLDTDPVKGDGVIVETQHGMEFGEVAQPRCEVEDDKVVEPLKPIIRLATDDDRRSRDFYRSKEKEAYSLCQEKIRQHGLDMKLVGAEYSFNGSKLVFYFTANERVDFRNLVKDLAFLFKTRIELRQIGVRDEANLLGGLGPCGRPVCCKSFLDEFRPVSIKMAKEQNLSLSPTKISGLCGRLMCCLQYEQAGYESMRKLMPRTGSQVVTVDGIGTVVENNAITERTRVRITAEDGSIDVRSYPYTHIAPADQPLPEIARVEAEQAAKQREEEGVRFDAHTPQRAPRPRGGRPQGSAAPAQGEVNAAAPRAPRSRGNRAPSPTETPAATVPARDAAGRNTRRPSAAPAQGAGADTSAATAPARDAAGRNTRRPSAAPAQPANAQNGAAEEEPFRFDTRPAPDRNRNRGRGGNRGGAGGARPSSSETAAKQPQKGQTAQSDAVRQNDAAKANAPQARPAQNENRRQDANAQQAPAARPAQGAENSAAAGGAAKPRSGGGRNNRRSYGPRSFKQPVASLDKPDPKA